MVKPSVLIEKMKLVSKNNKDWQTVYISRRQGSDYTNLFSLNIKGFDTYSSFYTSYMGRNNDTTQRPMIAVGYFMIDADSFSVYPERGTSLYLLKERKSTIAKFDLNGYLNKLDLKYDTTSPSYHDVYLPADKLTMDVESDSMLFRFAFKTINMEKNQSKLRIRELDADILSKHR